MLVLSRKVGERICIGDDVTIVVQRVAGGRVALAIEAPRDVKILRGELSPFENPKPSRTRKPLTAAASPAGAFLGAMDDATLV
jgi:carbon storage regulator CsrA